MSSHEPGEWVSIPVAAPQLGIHPVTLRKAIARGDDLPFRVVKIGRTVRIPQSDLDRLVGEGR